MIKLLLTSRQHWHLNSLFKSLININI
jgi:hypothetical protein